MPASQCGVRGGDHDLRWLAEDEICKATDRINKETTASRIRCGPMHPYIRWCGLGESNRHPMRVPKPTGVGLHCYVEFC